jgi:hypothetical protein
VKLEEKTPPQEEPAEKIGWVRILQISVCRVYQSESGRCFTRIYQQVGSLEYFIDVWIIVAIDGDFLFAGNKGGGNYAAAGEKEFVCYRIRSLSHICHV